MAGTCECHVNTSSQGKAICNAFVFGLARILEDLIYASFENDFRSTSRTYVLLPFARLSVISI